MNTKTSGEGVAILIELPYSKQCISKGGNLYVDSGMYHIRIFA